LTAWPDFCSVQPKHELLNAVEIDSGLLQAFQRKVQLFSVSNRNKQVSNFRRLISFFEEITQSKKVPFGFVHLFAVNQQMLAMNPKADKRQASHGLTLCDFIFVMRKNVIDTAAVYVQRFAEILHRHGRTFDVPAWTALAKRGLPPRLLRMLRRF